MQPPLALAMQTRLRYAPRPAHVKRGTSASMAWPGGSTPSTLLPYSRPLRRDLRPSLVQHTRGSGLGRRGGGESGAPGLTAPRAHSSHTHSHGGEIVAVAVSHAQGPRVFVRCLERRVYVVTHAVHRLEENRAGSTHCNMETWGTAPVPDTRGSGDKTRMCVCLCVCVCVCVCVCAT